MDHYAACLNASRECHDICTDILIHHCLPQGGDHASLEHVRRMLDCIDICRINADFMQRDSIHAESICHVCAAACDDCAESCEALGDRAMMDCAEICRDCARECRAMVAEAVRAAA